MDNREIGRKLRIEYHLLDKCNLNCKSCSHFSSLVEDETPKTLKQIENDFSKVHILTNNGDKDYIEKITIMGGEPLMYKKVSEALTIVRSLFRETEIELLTNGLLLEKIGDSFWESIIKNNITINISVYPINFDYDGLYRFLNYKEIRWRTYSINIENQRVFDSKWLKSDHDENYKELHYNCRWREWCTHLVDGKIYLCAMIAYFNHFDEKFKGQHNIVLNNTDSIDLDEINSWEDLQIERDKVPHFCGYCRGLDKGFEKWDVTKKDIKEWYQE